MRETDESGASLMKNSWILFLLLLPAYGAIDGSVTNRTAGTPQAGATVTLYKLGQNGMESVESVKSDAQGKFRIEQDVQGPRLIQTAYDGVTYNHMLPPGSPTTNLNLEVYNSSKRPGEAQVAQHMVMFEPSGAELVVSETYVFRNEGKTTYNDPDGGTLKFFLPEAAKGRVQVNAQAPQGMPIRRAAEKTSQPNVYKVDFPIKPGETRIDVNYQMPFSSPGVYESKLLYKGGPTRLVAPAGVTLKGSQIESLGTEPRTQATIYDVKGAAYKIEIEGAGSLRRSDAESAEDSGGPSIQQIMPRVYEKKTWILVLAFSILALGFTLLYRSQAPPETAAAVTAVRGKNERRRR